MATNIADDSKFLVFQDGKNYNIRTDAFVKKTDIAETVTELADLTTEVREFEAEVRGDYVVQSYVDGNFVKLDSAKIQRTFIFQHPPQAFGDNDPYHIMLDKNSSVITEHLPSGAYLRISDIGTDPREIVTKGYVDGNFVPLTGGQMTSELQIIAEENRSHCLFLKGHNENTVMYIEGQDGTTVFRVKGDGHVQAGHDAANAFMATKDHDVATKKYVDTKVVEATGVPGTFSEQGSALIYTFAS